MKIFIPKWMKMTTKIFIKTNIYKWLFRAVRQSLHSDIIDFSLRGIDGEMHSPGMYADNDVLVIIFMLQSLPVC